MGKILLTLDLSKSCFNIKCLLIMCSIILETSLPLPRTTNQYREYVYNRKTNAFYKLHIEQLYRSDAMSVCHMEGAELMLPVSVEDIEQAHALLKQYPDIGQYVWIDDDGKSHESAEESLIHFPEPEPVEEMTKCSVINRYSGEVQSFPMCYRGLPFVCKVAARDVPYDDLCDVFARGYDYYTSVGSCYKIPNAAYTWDQAYNECQREGAHLVVINSEAEHRVVWDVIRTAPRVKGVQATFFFYAGFRAERTSDGQPRVFKTVFNTTLEQAGFAEWSDGEPNNYMDTEYCGTLFLNDGKFNDVDCSHLYAFVCEKEVAKKTQ